MKSLGGCALSFFVGLGVLILFVIALVNDILNHAGQWLSSLPQLIINSIPSLVSTILMLLGFFLLFFWPFIVGCILRITKRSNIFIVIVSIIVVAISLIPVFLFSYSSVDKNGWVPGFAFMFLWLLFYSIPVLGWQGEI